MMAFQTPLEEAGSQSAVEVLAQSSPDFDRAPNTDRMAQHAPRNGLCRDFRLHRLVGLHALTLWHFKRYVIFSGCAD
jgi:hypothetical protein